MPGLAEPRYDAQREPSVEEAAAIAAAIEQFVRAVAPTASSPARTTADRWRQAAALEALERAVQHDMPDPWINT
jgi:hypothetical protein